MGKINNNNTRHLIITYSTNPKTDTWMTDAALSCMAFVPGDKISKSALPIIYKLQHLVVKKM
jgi:hypothetical protein